MSKLYQANCLRFFILFFAVYFMVVNGFASLPGHKIDSLAQEFLKKSGSTCLVIGIVDSGKTFKYCYGTVGNSQNKKYADSMTMFEIGSVTKLFTAISIAMAVHERQLNYNDPISKFLPPDRNYPHFKGEEIKIVQLLHHTSGLPRMPENFDVVQVQFDTMNPYKNYTNKNLYDYIAAFRLKEMPGTNFDYSNLGMGLAGNILSRIKKESYEKCIRRDIWSPLGMKSTAIALSSNQKERMAQPFDEKGKPDHLWDFDALSGAGAIRSDLVDMLLFLQANMRPDLVNDTLFSHALTDCQNKLIDAEPNLKVGLGWHNSPLDYDRLYWHNGGTGGFRSFIGFTKKYQKGIVILSNSATELDDTAVEILHLLDLEVKW